MTQAVQSYCRNCSSMCGITVEVEDNVIVDLKGDKRHALTTGYFCVKALTSMDLHNGDDRLLRAQARQADGRHGDIDADQAMDEIHDKLSHIIEEHGPGSVAMYYGTGANNNAVTHSAMKGWLHQIGSPYIFSSMTLDQSAKWVTMGRMGVFATGYQSALDADVLMEVGANPAASHLSTVLPMTNPMKWLNDARKRGMKLIVIDPVRTATASRADLHLQIKPGQDAVLFAGLIRLVLEKTWYDQAFCDRFVTGLDALRVAVDPFTLDLVEARTGVGQAMIVEAARLFSNARRKSAGSGTGPNMSSDSNIAEHMIAAFNAICGGYRRAGDRIRNTGLLYGRHVAQEQVFPPYRRWEHGPKLHSTDIGPMFGEYPSALLPREIMADGPQRIRALIVVGGNPVKAIGDPDKTLAAFKTLDLLIDLNPRLTDTGELAHYVIPTSIPYERHDYSGMYDSYWVKSFAQVARPLVERPPGIIDDWEFFWGLARRAGKPLELKQCGFGYAHPDIPGPTLTLDPGEKPGADDIVRWMCSHGRVGYDQLVAHPEGVAFDEDVIIAPAAVDDGARLTICPPDVAQELAALLPKTTVHEEYPFLLTVRRLLEAHNSAWQNAMRLRKRYPVNPVFMNPDDMDETGVRDGDRLRIASKSGSIIATVKSDKGMGRGVVAITHGFGAVDRKRDPMGKTGAFVGELVSIEQDLEAINYMPTQSAVPVTVEKFSPEPGAAD